MNITPETVGTIIGAAFIVIATAMGIIRQRKPNGSASPAPSPAPLPEDEDTGDTLGSAIDIAQDYRERLRDKEVQLNKERVENQKQIQALMNDYERRLQACLSDNEKLIKEMSQRNNPPDP